MKLGQLGAGVATTVDGPGDERVVAGVDVLEVLEVDRVLGGSTVDWLAPFHDPQVIDPHLGIACPGAHRERHGRAIGFKGHADPLEVGAQRLSVLNEWFARTHSEHNATMPHWTYAPRNWDLSSLLRRGQLSLWFLVRRSTASRSRS